MTDEMKELLQSIANADNAEFIAKLTEAIGQTEEALKKKDEEILEAKEAMIKYALRATGTQEGSEEEDESDETIDDVLDRWARDPKGEYDKYMQKGNN